MGDIEPSEDLFQSDVAHKDDLASTSSAPLNNAQLLSPLRNAEAGNASTPPAKEAFSLNNSELLGDKGMEWKNVTTLLSQMGIQLVHD